jgi:16S rRNA (cytosine1402-N4)-methyltransferase
MNISPRGKLIGFDMDIDAITFSRNHLRNFENRIIYVQGNFSDIRKHLDELGVANIAGLLLDLGLSSHQIDDVHRGFSFKEDSRIDMRMCQNQPFDGWKVINTYTLRQLGDIFWRYGEEKNSRRIATQIVEMRESYPIDTTGDLAAIITPITGQKFINKTLARIFQAIRIEVNNELQNLQKGLHDSLELLRSGGRIAVISYHSLEDRIVKDFFRYESQSVIGSNNKLIPDKHKNPRLKVLTKKPIIPEEKEITMNPRSRSAKLRIAERI